MKRVHFFDHQLLRARDLTTEQDYHRAMRHLHNRALHNWGIGDGLDVEIEGSARVRVTPGLGFDRSGREIILDAPVSLDVAALDLPDGDDCWVLASWGERPSDPTTDGGVAEHTRWLEQAEITLSPTTSADPGVALVLGRVERTGPAIASIDGSERVDIGLPDAAELQAAFARKVDRHAADTMRGPLTVETSLTTGELTVSGQARVGGPLVVGTAQARRRATVVGDLAVERGMIFTGRLDGSTASANEVLGGIGFFGLGVQHGQLSFRAGSGFELIDRSPDAPSLDYPHGRYQFADLRARSIFAAGNAVVGAGGAGTLSVRHVDGKRHDSDAPDPLYLNWATGQPVWVGGGQKSDLHVTGGLFADSGAFNLPSGGTMQSTGRLHIHSKERLYLLSLDNVHVGREWGGAGHLFVQGSVFAGGRGIEDLPSWSGGGVLAFDLFCFGGAYGKTKSFLIDHPLDPEGRHLLHGALEGPEHGVFYRGEGRLVNGTARIELPEYFEALTRPGNRTVTLTPKAESGQPVLVLGASSVRDGAFTVQTADATADQAFYWEVKAVRSDVDQLVVEVAKDENWSLESRSREHDARPHPIEA